MSTAASAAVIAANASTMNSARAHRIRTERCRLVVEQYDTSEVVTVQEMKEYASCVNFLHPSPSNPQDILATKALIIGGMIFALVGAWWGWKKGWEGERVANSVFC